MGAPSQISAGQQPKGNSSASGAAWTIPDPTGASIFSLAWHKLLAKRLNALINMRSVSDPTRSDLQMSDANCLLSVGGGFGSGGGSSGSGSLTKMRIFSVQGDYLQCNDTAGNSVNVAKPPLLRFSMTTRTINGYNYTYSYSLPNSRSITGTTNPGVFAVAEIIEPEYLVGDIIYAQNADHTDVFVSGQELPLIDTNIDQRGWVMEYGQ